jgi:predicted acetyltransferase
VEIRANSDTLSFLRPISIGLGGSEPGEDGAERFAQLMEADRRLSAFEDGRVVGSAGSFAFELTVPGGFVPAAGVTVVATLPTHRRRGVLTELMRAQLDDARGRGEHVAYLWASDERIYGRFGYGLASLATSIDVPVATFAYRDDPGKCGSVRLLAEDEAGEVLPPIYDRIRRESPGFFSRDEPWWRLRRLGRPFGVTRDVFRAVWEDSAYALYTVAIDFAAGPAGELEVIECLGATPEATREIWRYLFSVDVVEHVKAHHLAVDQPLLHLVQQPRRLNARLYDSLWVRLVDVGAALEARALGEGSVVLELADAFLPDNAGRWRVGGDGVGRTDAAPELELEVAVLGSLYLSGFTVAELERAGRVHELVPGAVARADAVLRWDRKPWCPEIF